MAGNGIGAATASERITAIDALRGFALLGILYANLPYWAGLPFASPAQAAAISAPVGREAYSLFFNGILDGKFYTLFSALFGLGFALQLDRLTARGADGLRIFRRRMAALLLIGCLHIFLVWDGDILTLYAALGFVLPAFRRCTDRALVGWGLFLLFLVPLAGVFAQQSTGFDPGAPLFALGGAIAGLHGLAPSTNLLDFASTGGWSHYAAWQSTGSAFNYAERLENWRIAKVLGCMLIGMAAGRMLVRGTLLDNRRLLWSVVAGGAAIGIPAMAFYIHLPPHSQAAWSSLIGTAPLGFAYGAAFLLAWPHARRVLAVFAPVGRMALTNYLTHSIVVGLCAFGWGFGLMGKVSLLAVYGWGSLLYLAQIAFSHAWLARHRQGPVEAIWRRMTYGKALQSPMTSPA